jgi:hypothetical protein
VYSKISFTCTSNPGDIGTTHFLQFLSILVELKGRHGLNATMAGHFFGFVNTNLVVLSSLGASFTNELSTGGFTKRNSKGISVSRLERGGAETFQTTQTFACALWGPPVRTQIFASNIAHIWPWLFEKRVFFESCGDTLLQNVVPRKERAVHTVVSQYVAQ